jgi:heme-degrading monooxygenase HmoA
MQRPTGPFLIPRVLQEATLSWRPAAQNRSCRHQDMPVPGLEIFTPWPHLGAAVMPIDRQAIELGREPKMFIAMNRFRVARGSEQAFEQVWLSRDSHLDKVPGFIEFHLLKGPEAEDHTLYASHTVWKSSAAFEAWTRSDAFRAAHHKAGDNKPLYLDHPKFEGFEVRQTVAGGKADAA